MATLDLQSIEEASRMGKGEADQTENFKPTTCGEKFKKGLKDNIFTILTLIGVALGFGIGFGVAPLNPSQQTVTWISK